MSKRLILPRRAGSAPLLKSHVKDYDRKDGTHVSAHDDKRQKKAADPYSHPHVVGKATVTDSHATGPHDASMMQFAGTDYATTGKQGKSFHDETPVREFENEADGHRVWMDHSGRVHADSKHEVEALRKKHEAHSAGEAVEGSNHGELPGKGSPKGPANKAEFGEDDAWPAKGDRAKTEKAKTDKVEKSAVLEAALGKAAGGVAPSLPPSATTKQIQQRLDDYSDKVKPLGFDTDKAKPVDANGNGSIELINAAGQRVIIMSQDGGDRTKVSVSLLDAVPGADKAAGGAGGGSAAPKPAEAAGGGEMRAKGAPKEKKAKGSGGKLFKSLRLFIRGGKT